MIAIRDSSAKGPMNEIGCMGGAVSTCESPHSTTILTATLATLEVGTAGRLERDFSRRHSVSPRGLTLQGRDPAGTGANERSLPRSRPSLSPTIPPGRSTPYSGGDRGADSSGLPAHYLYRMGASFLYVSRGVACFLQRGIAHEQVYSERW